MKLPPSVRLLCCLVLLAFFLFNSGCTPAERHRPYGVLRLGKVADFKDFGEFNLEEARLLIRHDQNGLSAMSTLCTKDLSPLVRKDVSGRLIWASDYSASTYSDSGKVLTGPAVANLPYFRLRIDSAIQGGPQDTLYADIGKEEGDTWRLKI